MIRTRFAPSPTGYMHIGNLRTALYEYLIAKSKGGTFVLRIEDTDAAREVAGAADAVFNTLKITGLKPDEGPGFGGEYGPYIQSERMDIYSKYAKELVETGKAYYCFCTKERLSSLKTEEKGVFGYDGFCLGYSGDDVQRLLNDGTPWVIRQKMPVEGDTTFTDMVFGEITVPNSELDDQVLIKADGYPTYNFANVVDDHLMQITHVVRGSEYLSSTPKYNLLYEAFGWEIPHYIHCPPVMKDQKNKLSKRQGDASFEDLLDLGLLPEAIINYIALLGWSPPGNEEIFSLKELIEVFDVKNLSKSPAVFDMQKLKWLNGEYIKKMEFDNFWELSKERFEAGIKSDDFDRKRIAAFVKTRIETLNDIEGHIDFIDELPEYDISMYTHKKMKTDASIALSSLRAAIVFLDGIKDYSEGNIHARLFELIESQGLKNGQMLWPLRCALSGKETSFCGAVELLSIFGASKSISRIKKGIVKLEHGL